jgi:hypothetical protein
LLYNTDVGHIAAYCKILLSLIALVSACLAVVKLEIYVLNDIHRLKFDPNERVRPKMKEKRWDLQFNVGCEPWQNPTVYNIYNHLNLSQTRGHEEKCAPSSEYKAISLLHATVSQIICAPLLIS